MNGLDYSGKLAAAARERALAAAAKARREGRLDRLEPAFPYRVLPFPATVFGAESFAARRALAET